MVVLALQLLQFRRREVGHNLLNYSVVWGGGEGGEKGGEGGEREGRGREERKGRRGKGGEEREERKGRGNGERKCIGSCTLC